MAMVFGLDIPDDKMAGIARSLLRAHACFICLGLAFCVLECAEYFALKDVKGAKGDDDASDTQDFASDGTTVVVYVFLFLTCPLCAFFVARAGLKMNNASTVQLVSFLDGSCSCCMCCGILVGILSIISSVELKDKAQSSDCGQLADVQRCEERREKLLGEMSVMTTTTVLSTILITILFVVCLVGTYKSTEARAALLQADVFCVNLGAPAPVEIYNPQPGTIMVVGHAVEESGVPIGRPMEEPAGPTKAGQSVFTVGRPVEGFASPSAATQS